MRYLAAILALTLVGSAHAGGYGVQQVFVQPVYAQPVLQQQVYTQAVIAQPVYTQRVVTQRFVQPATLQLNVNAGGRQRLFGNRTTIRVRTR